MGSGVTRRRRIALLRFREKIIRADIPLDNKIKMVRLVDDCIHLFNKRSICFYEKGTIAHKALEREIKERERYIEALEVMDEIKRNNCSIGELRSSKEAITTLRKYAVAD